MTKLFVTVSLFALLTICGFGQSRDEGSPTPVSGMTINATLVDDSSSSYQIYYYSMNLAAGRYRARIRSRTRECNGSSVSVYVGGVANVGTASCDINNGVSTGEHDFEITTAGNKVIAIYVSGGNNERFEVELAFTGGGPYVVGPGKGGSTGVTITRRVEPGTNPSGSTVVVAPSGTGPTPAGGSRPSAEAKPKPEEPLAGPVCTFQDLITLSNTNRSYSRTFDRIFFKSGRLQISFGTVAPDGSAIPGGGRITFEPVGSVSRFKPGIGLRLLLEMNVPSEFKVLKTERVKNRGEGRITVAFTQARGAGDRAARYQVVLRGEAITECGPNSSTLRQATPIE